MLTRKEACIIITLLLIGLSAQSMGDLTEIYWEMGSPVSHKYSYDEITDTYDVQDSTRIPLPMVYLEPGDIFRVNMRFFEESYLQLINNPDSIGIRMYLFTEDFDLSMGASPVTNDGMISLHLEEYQGFVQSDFSKTSSGGIYEEDLYEFGAIFSFSNNDFDDNALLRSFEMEFQVPTMVGDAPFSPYYYSNSYIRIGAFRDNVPYDLVLLSFTPIPEPTTLLLLAVGGFIIRRTRVF
jgi:hypothetical protein